MMTALPSRLTGSGYPAFLESADVQVHRSLALRHSPALGFYFTAEADIPHGEQLLAVPVASCLDLGTSTAPFRELKDAGCPPVCLSSLEFLRLLQGGSLGEHATVLSQLPPIPNVLSWGQREEALLKGTSLERSIESMPLRQRYRDIIAPFLARGGGAAFPRPGEVTEEAFLRCASLVMSRCFHASSLTAPSSSSSSSIAAEATSSSSAPSSAGPSFLPVADFFNHHPTLACTQSALVGDSFRFYALRPVGVGEQVYLTYGELSDAQLLHTYGFIIEEEEGATNPHNSAHIPFEALFAALAAGGPRAGGARAEKRREALKAQLQRLLPHGCTILASAAKEGAEGGADPLLQALPPALLTAVQLAQQDLEGISAYAREREQAGGGQLLLPLLPPSEVAEQLRARAAAGAAEGGGDDDDEEGGEDMDDVIDAWTLLLLALRSAMGCYPSSLKQDREWLAAVRQRRGASSAAAAAAAPGINGGAVGSSSAPVWDWSEEAHAAVGATDDLYRACRLISMREKELLWSVVAAIDAELNSPGVRELGGSEGEGAEEGSEESGGHSDSSDEEEDVEAEQERRRKRAR